MDNNDPLVTIIRRKLAIDAGILPLDDCPRHFDFNKFLESMPPDEARGARRKFRKLWRQISRRIIRQTNTDPQQFTGDPNRYKSNSRKDMVAKHFHAEALRLVKENSKKWEPR